MMPGASPKKSQTLLACELATKSAIDSCKEVARVLDQVDAALVAVSVLARQLEQARIQLKNAERALTNAERPLEMVAIAMLEHSVKVSDQVREKAAA